MSTSTPRKPLQILVSAYACRPGMGSEPGVGWNVVRELAHHHVIHVLTRKNNRSAIEAELKQHPLQNLQFTYLDPPVWAAWLPSAQVPHYYFWQIQAYWVTRKLLKYQHFDLIHHVTYVRYSTPSFLSLLPVPFVWGPVGGGEQAPEAFWQSFNVRGKAYEILRSLAHSVGEYDPFTKLTARRSVLARATTSDTAKRLHRLGAKHIETISALGLSSAEITQLGQYATPEPSPLRFITMARLLHWKGIHLGIEAFAQIAQQGNYEYWILGEGPERQTLETSVQNLKLTDRIKFLGQLSRDKTLQTLADCHILLHPSLHDSGGFVCLEAMAAGRPVICLNIGGSAVQVTQETGILVAADNPQQAIGDLAQAMSNLATDARLRKHMGEAGRAHVQANFSWEAKGIQLAEFYHNYIAENKKQHKTD